MLDVVRRPVTLARNRALLAVRKSYRRRASYTGSIFVPIEVVRYLKRLFFNGRDAMKFPARQRAIAAAIAQARNEAGLSQRQVSEKLGEPSNWMQRIESLERRVDVAEFVAIARVIDIDPIELLRRALR